MTLSNSIGLAGQILLLTSITSVWCRHCAPRIRYSVLIGLTLILLVPVQGLPLAAYPRGVWGDLSITTMGLGLIEWIAPRRACEARRQLLWLLPVGILLSASALGFLPHNYYRWGYQPEFGVALSVAALIMWCLRAPSAWLLLAASGGWQLNLLESRNAWDYVLDVPLLVWLACIALNWAYHAGRSALPLRALRWTK